MEAFYLPKSELSLAQGTGGGHMTRDIEVIHKSKANNSCVLQDFRQGAYGHLQGWCLGLMGGARPPRQGPMFGVGLSWSQQALM